MFVSEDLSVNEKNHLVIGKNDTVELAKEFGTPLYVLDEDLFRKNCRVYKNAMDKYYNGNGLVLYANKAFCSMYTCKIVAEEGLGADVVSGGELYTAIKAGFPMDKIYFHGNNKTVEELELAVTNGVGHIICDNIYELEKLNEIAKKHGVVQDIMFRIKPGIDAHTHSFIQTGQIDSKFGVALENGEAFEIYEKAHEMSNVNPDGIHCHIGSQILDMGDFIALCNRVNELQDKLEARRILVEHINVGGGLGIDYGHPNRQSVPDFKSYFATYAGQLKLRPYQTLHFELGRAVVGQCGSLISKVLYVKQGTKKKFAILDAGMTDLIRPALYQAYHKMENITSEEPVEAYDVVGPICESSDVFGKAIDLNKVKRGDLIALRSAGAYGEIMASGYNCRELPKGYTSDELV